MQLHSKIWQYLQGHLPNDETTAFRNWINSSKKNRDTFDLIKIIWALCDQLTDIISFDPHENWNSITRKLTRHNSKDHE